MFYGSNRSKVRTFGSDSASAQNYTFCCEKKERMSLIHEAPCHGASSISYRKSIVMRFPFRLYILRRMYRLRLPTPIASLLFPAIFKLVNMTHSTK